MPHTSMSYRVLNEGNLGDLRYVVNLAQSVTPQSGVTYYLEGSLAIRRVTSIREGSNSWELDVPGEFLYTALESVIDSDEVTSSRWGYYYDSEVLWVNSVENRDYLYWSLGSIVDHMFHVNGPIPRPWSTPSPANVLRVVSSVTLGVRLFYKGPFVYSHPPTTDKFAVAGPSSRGTFPTGSSMQWAST